MADWALQFTHDLDSDQHAEREFGDPRGPRDTVVEHQRTVRSAIDPRGRHPVGRGPEASDLCLELEWVGATGLRREKMQLSGIDNQDRATLNYS
jgi:hypothetical protein